MNLQKYNVKVGNRQTFVENFKKLMDIEVKNIIVIENLTNHVEPIGKLPVGFVLQERGKWYLVGYSTTKKRCHPQNLYPHRKKELLLYGNWTNKKWTYREMYNCIFQRLRQLDDLPNVISSIQNWEYNRQAIFSCVKLLSEDILDKLKDRELKLLHHVMTNNDELLNHTCSALCITNDIKILSQKVCEMYDKNIKFDNEQKVWESGILKLIEDHVSSKWF